MVNAGRRYVEFGQSRSLRRVVVVLAGLGVVVVRAAQASEASDNQVHSSQSGGLLCPLLGDYFLPDAYDPTRLSVQGDGTFFWSIEGYDFGVTGDDGCWRIERGALVLSPLPGEPGILWPGRGGPGVLEELKLLATAAGGLLLAPVFRNSRPEPLYLDQLWVRGRVCVLGGANSRPRLIGCDAAVPRAPSLRGAKARWPRPKLRGEAPTARPAAAGCGPVWRATSGSRPPRAGAILPFGFETYGVSVAGAFLGL